MRRSALAVMTLMLVTGCADSIASGESLTASVSATASAPSAERDACAEQEVGLVEILAVDPESRAECFGTKSISFRAYVSSMVGVGGYPEQLKSGDGWLDPYSTPHRLLVPIPGDDQRVLAALVPPAMSLEDVLTDRWAILTGHFADPASDTCGRVEVDGSVTVDAATVAACRSLFVIESVAPGA